MRVHVLSKVEFDGLMVQNKIVDENVEKFDSIFFISLIDNHNQKGHYFKKDHNNVMNLRFDDVEHDGENPRVLADDPDLDNMDSENVKAFSKKQANDLYKFIKKHRDAETCIVHCMAGISRSGAVGTFVNGFAQGDWELFKRDNPFISPNGRVHRMLNTAKYNDYEK